MMKSSPIPGINPANGDATASTEARRPATPADLFACLERLGIKTTTVQHEPVFTVSQSEAIHRHDLLPGAHIKNLFLKDKKGRLYLVVAQHDTQVDLKKLHKVIGSDRLSFGKPELLMETLGVEPGSVTPFALINDEAGNVSVILDETLADHDLLNCHPLHNTATTNISREELLQFIADCGHEPRFMALGAQD